MTTAILIVLLYLSVLATVVAFHVDENLRAMRRSLHKLADRHGHALHGPVK